LEVSVPHAKVNGINMYYEVYGEGFPLVFVSGTGGTHHSWKYFQVPFFKQHYTCIISDHRGLGQTDKPDEHYSTRGFAADQVELLKVLGYDKAHFMGHSMGGRVCQWIALDHPEVVQALVLSGSGPGQWSPDVYWPRGVPLGEALGMIELGIEKYYKDHYAVEPFMFSEEFIASHPEIIKLREESAGSGVPDTKCYLRHIIARQEHETTALLPQIDKPTLVIHGANDSVGASHVESAKALHKGIKGSIYKTFPGRHGYLWESADQVNPYILNFLQQHDPVKA
jgi:3-oxoadipate enol-lactonase